jgi:DNA-binding IclR family transcriptional regulator
LAGAVPVPRDVTAVSRRVCEELAEEFGETVNLAVADGGAVVNIDQVRGGTGIISHNWIGERTPLHATSSGKVLMAFDEVLFVAATRRPLTRHTPATLVHRRELADELAEVRRLGIAFTHEELEVGLSAAAAPVRRQDGAVVAAVSVSGPTFRLDQQRLADLGKAVAQAAEEISRRLGWSPGHRCGQPRP